MAGLQLEGIVLTVLFGTLVAAFYIIRMLLVMDRKIDRILSRGGGK